MILRRIAAAALIAGSFIASAAQAQTLRFGHANTTAEIAGELEWMVSVDSTIARAHQHAAGAPKIASAIDQEDSQTPEDGTGGRIELQGTGPAGGVRRAS